MTLTLISETKMKRDADFKTATKLGEAESCESGAIIANIFSVSYKLLHYTYVECKFYIGYLNA